MAKSGFSKQGGGFQAAFALCALVWAACGPAVQAQSLRADGSGYELQVLVDGRPASNLRHAGEDYVMGRLGARYTLRVINHSGRRIEAVVSVDGLDVIDGKRADFNGKRGYLVPAWGSIDIDGWRLSEHQAAAFRFSSVTDSYAGRTGAARNVGVIGAAIFPERPVPPPIRMPIRPEPYPYLHRYDQSADAPRGEAEASLRSESKASGEAPPTAPAPARELGNSGRGASAAAAPQKRRPGLGTEFGEAVHSDVTEVEFVRASPRAPAQLLGVRYNDRDGLIALGVEVEPRCDAACREADLRRNASPFPVSYQRYATPPSGWRSW